MAFIPLGKIGNAGMVLSGYGKPYLKTASYAKGVNPEQLKPYQNAFASASKECSAATKDMEGIERSRAKSQCMSGKLKK